MKNILIILLSLTSFYGFSQDESCELSDGYYHYQVLLIINDIPVSDFNKNDFITYLEVNSNISATDSEFLNENIIEVFKQYPNEQEDPSQKILYLISNDYSLQSFLTAFNESIGFVNLYCDCANSDGYFFNYTRLIIDDIPSNDFDKMDFIQHLLLNSNITSNDFDFLNSTIIEAYPSFPSSQNESLQKSLSIISTYDLMSTFLNDFTESIDLVELICGEAELSTSDFSFNEQLKIIPNPVTENSYILIENPTNFQSLEVININGKIMYSKKIKNLNKIYLNQFKLDNGIYFLKLDGNDISISKKIIVRKM